jgi:hypothetical protein
MCGDPGEVWLAPDNKNPLFDAAFLRQNGPGIHLTLASPGDTCEPVTICHDRHDRAMITTDTISASLAQ